MALIGTLRNKMGTWVVIFVFVAIVAFILNDLLGNNSVLFNNNDVGKIGGHSISLEEYQQAISEREANYILNFGRQPGDREMNTLRQQAWDMLILRYAIQEEMNEAGVVVTTNEVEDMIWGKNVDDNIKQTPLFNNPETGQFEKARVVRYLNEFNSAPPSDPQQLQMWQEQRTRWEVFQRDLAPGRQRVKYENLLLKTNYITKAEAEREYHNQSDVAEVKFVYIPYATVSDTVAKASDDDFDDYYNAHKEEFKTKESRDLKYVTFPIAASAQDSVAIREDMARIAEELKITEDDSAYAATNTDGQEPFAQYNTSNLPQFIDPATLQKGQVVGPFLDGNVYKVVKLTSISKDSLNSARASHILITWENETDAAKKDAKENARKLLKDLKGGADFATMARLNSKDPGSAQNGGDLGWFTDTKMPGGMVKPFREAVFNATKTGLLNDVVESEFGYHIISITNTKVNTLYGIAVVERTITPSDATTNEILRNAESFASELSGVEAFEARAKENGLNVQESRNIKVGDRRVGNLGDARQIIQWLFRDAEQGNVSTVFEQPDEYVVAVMTKETEEGHRSLADVKDEITPKVQKEVKSKVIISKVKDLSGNTLEELASSYGPDANVYSSSDLKLNASSIPGAGFDPESIGLAFALDNGKRSAPFKGENGVIVMEVQNKTVAPEVADYSAYKAAIEQNSQQRSSFAIAEVIKDYANIVDKRYKFY